jgi:hypothetical protein
VFPVRRLAPDGLEAWTQVIERGYEGYVAKDEASLYEGGPTRRWLKAKQKSWTVEEDRWQRRISVAPPTVDRQLRLGPSRTRMACGRLPAVTLLTELDAYFTDHMRCGDLDAGIDWPVVWIACPCDARMARPVDEAPPCQP